MIYVILAVLAAVTVLALAMVRRGKVR